MSEIERLACAVAAVEDREFIQPRHREIVRAILQAMREPTQTQYDALCATGKMWREQTSATVWKTYIDALLAE